MEQRQQVFNFLDGRGVEYRVVEHGAVYTIEEMAEIAFGEGVEIAKNLFLRDAKGKRHFLVMLPGEKAARLKELQQKLDSTVLSFASEERLMKHLGLTKGAVTPYGVLNDADHAVEVVVDEALLACPLIGVHPNDNTATVLVKPQDVIEGIRACGNRVTVLAL